MQIKNLVFVLLLCTSPILIHAQFGLTLGYQATDAPDWDFSEAVFQEPGGFESPGDMYSIGIDYWFRLKNRRIEFLPELNYSWGESDFIVAGNTIRTEFFSFFFNTNIYFLDLASDCDCPTFSKQNDFFKKGLFLQLSPGVTLPNFDLTPSGGAEMGNPSANIAVGLGLDIGILDIITITPMIKARYFPNMEWSDNYPTGATDRGGAPILGSQESAVWTYFAGLRFGFRFDDW